MVKIQVITNVEGDIIAITPPVPRKAAGIKLTVFYAICSLVNW